MSVGTPKTLDEAIQNGINEHEFELTIGGNRSLKDLICLHVQDFIAQKFGAEMLRVDDPLRLQFLFESIKGYK